MNSRILTIWFSLFAAAVLLAVASLCSFSAALGGPPPQAGAACCSVTRANPMNGVVTAKVNSTGQQFQFTLGNLAQARTLRIGQAVYANFSTRQVSLDGKTP